MRYRSVRVDKGTVDFLILFFLSILIFGLLLDAAASILGAILHGRGGHHVFAMLSFLSLFGLFLFGR